MSTQNAKRPSDLLYSGRIESITRNTCAMTANDIGCVGDGEALEFRDDVSKREYRISGMCQACQDAVWGSE